MFESEERFRSIFENSAVGISIIDKSGSIIAVNKPFLKITGYKIRRAARIGIGVLVLPGIEIGENSMIGVGSVVTKDVPPREVWFGNPAIKQGNVPEDEIL